MAKILIVDDSGMSRRALHRILEPAGHEVLDAEDGMAGLERYVLDRPDVVLLDMTMRGMHGLEVLDRLRALDPAVRVVVATADVQHSTRTLVAAAGGRGFITKPFTAEQVLATVDAVLTGAV